MNYLGLLVNTFVQKKQPISLIHLITRRCNARCKHCFIDFDAPLPLEDELSTEEITRLTETFGGGLFNIYIAGGEPFLRKDIFEIVAAYCNDTAVESVNIATNGMYTEAVACFIDKFRAAGLGRRLMFSISIDNFEAQHDGDRRVPGLYKRAIATYKLIESYNDKKIIPTVAITVTPYNCMNVAGVYRSLRSSGVRAFSAILMREQGVVKVIEEKRNVLKAHAELVRLIEADQLRGTTIGTGSDLLGCYVNARNSVFNRTLPALYLTRGTSFNCSAGTLFGVIFPNGDVCPCEVQERFIMGNLRDYKMDFMKLWSGRKARAVRREMRKEKCACTFDGTWAVNILSNIGFLPPLLFYFIKNIFLFLKRRRLPVPSSPARHSG
jgi:MoaA/NifB/PqqE/SkfB family radical SAM enzyme